MPAPLPTSWKADQAGPGETFQVYSSFNPERNARWEAISFFVAGLLLFSGVVQILWNILRRDFASLPKLSYGRALSLVCLWGLCFVVVLTMISGARELMTPGAWKKQGWTYTLEDKPILPDKDQQMQALENLRHFFWHYAALNEGQLPSIKLCESYGVHWDVPGWPGLQFTYVEGLDVKGPMQPLAFGPEVDNSDRLVLFTNGSIAPFSSSEIESMLKVRKP